MVYRRVTSALAALGVLTAGSSVLAQGQVSPSGAVGAALGAPVQPRIAAPPAAPTIKAGDGGGLAGGPKTLEEAFALCDMSAALALGGGNPRDALRVLVGQGHASSVNLDTAAWAKLGDDFTLFWLQQDGQRFNAGASGTIRFEGWTPPNLAALPIADDIFGPQVYPPQTEGEKATAQRMRTADSALVRNAMAGMSAPDAAAAYYAAMPQLQSSTGVMDLSQAYFVRCTAYPSTRGETPAICLREPAWGPTGNDVRAWQLLRDEGGVLDPLKFPGYASLPWIDDPRPGLKIPAEVERRRALPPPPPRPAPPPRPPARNC